jgi:hypothetical protein
MSENYPEGVTGQDIDQAYENKVRDIMNAAAGHEAGDIIEVPTKRVFTFTRTYRIETTLSDEELIKGVAGLDSHIEIESVVEALDVLTMEHECSGDTVRGVTTELHSASFEERDPGFF